VQVVKLDSRLSPLLARHFELQRQVCLSDRRPHGNVEVEAAPIEESDDADPPVIDTSEAMLSDVGFDGEALTARGAQIDDIIGIVQQMSEHFYDSGGSDVI
jgi:hypothetical protein